jgi:lipoprotein NlpD
MTSHRSSPTHRMLSLFALAGALLLAGCTTPRPPAPVEERSTSRVPPKPPVTEAPKPVEPAPATTDTRSATYTVKPGDTLMRIALESGQAWRDIARWNGIENPNVIEVGQVLRVLPPTAGDAVVATKPLTAPKVETKPLDANGKPPAAAASSASAPASPMGPAVPSRDNDDDVQWAWPAAGPVAANFDEARNKGLAITGKAGDPVYAAADGRVVYAGSGLRGYGNLVIVKHNATYLTAYAHNQTLLVKEDQVVRKGQKIAEMGASDAERVQLHFEVRRQGKPVDPAKLLPPR